MSFWYLSPLIYYKCILNDKGLLCIISFVVSTPAASINLDSTLSTGVIVTIILACVFVILLVIGVIVCCYCQGTYFNSHFRLLTRLLLTCTKRYVPQCVAGSACPSRAPEITPCRQFNETDDQSLTIQRHDIIHNFFPSKWITYGSFTF